MWLATRSDAAGVWNQAGGSFATEYGGLWDDESDDTGDNEEEAREGEDGREPKYLGRAQEEVAAAAAGAAGDGHANEDGDGKAGSSTVWRNELVFIGIGMDNEALKAELERCLLTEEEMAGGPAEWERRLLDPFPQWE